MDWAIRPNLAAPLAIRRAREPGLVAVLMGRPGECFAVAMPHHDEPHYSLYLSLFGRTIRAGERARARACLAVLDDSETDRIEAMYGEWLSGLAAER